MEPRHRARPLLGIACRIGATIGFTVMGALVKLVSERYPVGEIMFFRSFCAIPPILLWTAWLGQLGTVMRTERIGMHFSRTVIGFTAMCLLFGSLAYLPLADMTAINYATPLIIVVLAAVVLRERVRLVRGSAVVIGFIGVMIILSDYVGVQGGPVQEATLLGAAMAFAAAFFVAMVAVLVRQLTRTESVATIVLYFACFASLIALLSSPFGWSVPDFRDLAILVAIGFVGSIGQILATHSYAYADASIVAPFDYASMLWAVILGYLIFGDLPTASVLAGAAVVIVAGLIVIFRERQLAIARAKEPPSVVAGG